MTKQQRRSLFVKFWLKRLLKISIVTAVGVFIFKTFIHNPIPNFQARNAENIEILPIIDESSMKMSNSEAKDIVVYTDIDILNEIKNDSVEFETTSSIEIKDDEKFTFTSEEQIVPIEPLNKERAEVIQANIKDELNDNKKESFVKLEYEVIGEPSNLLEPKNGQTDSINKIIRQITLDKAVNVTKQPSSYKPLLNLPKEIENNNLKTQKAAIKETLIETPFQNSEPKKEKKSIAPVPLIQQTSVNNDEIQKMYLQDLERLSSEAELENLLKRNFSQYINN